MSAICGVFNIDGKAVSPDMASAMANKLSTYNMNTSEIWNKEQIFMGCRLKYITPESIEEKLPFYDYNSGLAITADAIIDNRSELFNMLEITPSDSSIISDSQLILLSYKRWGEECTKYLVGDFAFVIWNDRKKELFCARDHVGKRTFYYYYSKSVFAFCTTVNPLFDIDKNRKEVNDAWVADFLSLPGVAHEFECNQTVYKGIMQLLPAHILRVSHREFKMQQYWFPLDMPKLNLKSDSDYEEAFREVFSEAIRCRLRAIGPIGVMLSGGLDSGSVACVAAKQLAEQGKSLKAFSSIPFSGYKNWLPKTFVADEKAYIETIIEKYKNIDLTYCSCENKSSFTDIERFIEMLEQPYKIVENLFWYDEVAETAAKQGCSVLLDGQFGNLTISYGNFWTHTNYLFRRGKLKTLLGEVKGYSILHDLNAYKVIKDVAHRLLPYSLQKLIAGISDKKYDFTEYLPVNPELFNRYDVKRRFKEEGWGIYPAKTYNLETARSRILKPQSFSHIGALETKVSLAHGIAKRDPTRDKRVIEFCLRLPGEQFVRGGKERQLVRNSMEGILPDSIRLNYNVRGQQSADWVQRIAPVRDKIHKELEEMLEKDILKSYLDIDKLKKILNEVDNSFGEDKWMEIRMLLISLIFGCFLNKIED
jgi:asparagine synthase (glutamine-hydrolysing)